MPGLEASGERIDRLLDQLGGLAEPEAREWAEELVRVVTDLYGEGLARIVDACGPELVERVAGDELVGALLMLHGLHPTGLRQRVQQALDALPSLLGVDDARVVEADEEEGRVQIRLLLAPGRAAHRDQVEKVVRDAVDAAAPDALSVVVDCPDTGQPVAFRGRRNNASPVP